MNKSENTELNNIPSEYQPISIGAFIGYNILFAIPCIGLILMIIFSFGGTKNINVKNIARGYLIMALIVFIFTFCLTLFTGASIFSAASNMTY